MLPGGKLRNFVLEVLAQLGDLVLLVCGQVPHGDQGLAQLLILGLKTLIIISVFN